MMRASPPASQKLLSQLGGKYHPLAVEDMTMKSGIDPEILRRVVGNDPEMFCEVLEDFVWHAQSEIAAIRVAVASEDAEQMKIPTHRLKGSASLVGAAQLVDACTQIETAVEANDWSMIHQLMPRLDGLMQDINAYAEALLGAQPIPHT
jgi:two-component system sensor histidine kinase EvgS